MVIPEVMHPPHHKSPLDTGARPRSDDGQVNRYLTLPVHNRRSVCLYEDHIMSHGCIIFYFYCYLLPAADLTRHGHIVDR
jgi:hypothetical protein